MALIQCPNCGREISDKATKCIHCKLILKDDYSKIDNSMGVQNGNSKAAKSSSSIVLIIVIIIFLVFTMTMCSNSGNSSSSSSKTSSSSKEYCSMCGGELKCAICGKDGLYCEYASYGKGSAHYCAKHWANCVEWHEGK